MISLVDFAPFDTLRQLNLSRLSFYLSGSRYFGYARPDSDWDLFAGKEVIEYLIQKGFKRISMNPNWLDINTISIYEHVTGVEVSIQKDAMLKVRAQKWIKDHKLKELKASEPFDRNQIWNIAFEECRR